MCNQLKKQNMELVLHNLDLDPLPEPKAVLEITSNKGLLNSNYKQVVNCNFEGKNSQSIFGIRQRIKNNRSRFTPSIDVILKLSVFAIALAVII